MAGERIGGGGEMSSTERDRYLDRALRILESAPLIDGHNDLPWQYRVRAGNHLDKIDLAGDTSRLDPPMHTDLARLRTGRLGAQFWALFLPSRFEGPGAARALFEQIDVTVRMIERHPDVFELARTADDIERIFAAGGVASVLAIEGGHAIEGSLAVLRQAYACGARYMTLTHNETIAWADSATDEPRHGGLTAFGREVVREMNRLGMMVDLSHTAPATMHAAMDTSAAPVIFSHSSARALCDHPRNVPDELLARVTEVGGIVMATFVPPFVSQAARVHRALGEAEERRLEAEGADAEAIERKMSEWLEANPAPRATLEQVADHIDHLSATAGVDHVGIGSDFDGITMVPIGLEDVSRYPALIAELLRRGYGDEEVAKIAGGNLLRVMREVEAVGRKLRSERPPSDALIEELDNGGGAAH
jgi:membrane dipeptidase